MGLTAESMLVPSGHLERLGERKMTGSTFSASSSSKDAALRLMAVVGVERAVGSMRLIVYAKITSEGLSARGNWERAEVGREEHTILTVLEAREGLQARGIDGAKGLSRRCHSRRHSGGDGRERSRAEGEGEGFRSNSQVF